MWAHRSARVCSWSLFVVVAAFAASAAAESVQTTFTKDANTAGLWLFKEGSGTSTANEMGPTHPQGTFQGAVWAMGRQYYAAALDQGYVQILDETALHPSTAITVEAWVKAQQSGGYIVCKNGNYFLTLGGPVTATFTLLVSGTTSTSFNVNGNATFPVGQWTHVAMTYDSTSKKGCIYINGVLDAYATYTGSGAGTLYTGYNSTFRLGQNDWGPTGSEFDGKIDSLRISNVARVFTPLYPPNPGAPTPPGNLVPNGDFESGLMGWRLNGYGDTNLCWETTSGAATGQRCLHTLSTAINDYLTTAPPASGKMPTPPSIISRPIPAHPGRKYTFSCRLKTVGSNVYPQIGVYQCGGPSDITTLYSGAPFPAYPTVTTLWSQFTQSFTLPSTFSAPSMCVQFGYPSSGAQLYVDDVRLIAGDGPAILALKDKISVGPWTGLPVGNVFVAGATSPLTLNIVNTDTVAHTVTVQPTITDWEERPVSGIPSLGSVAVPAAAVKTLTYNVDTTRRGAFRLGFNLTSEGQTWHQLAELKYAVLFNMQNLGNPDTSIFGMNTHMDHDPTPFLTREMQVFSKCGIKWIRAWWGWGMCQKLQPPPDVYDWTEYDRQYNAVTNGTGIRLMPCMLRYTSSPADRCYEQSWAGPLTFTNSTTGETATMQIPPLPTMMGEWGTFCGAVAQHFAGNIKAYELWNEPGYDDKGSVTTAVYTTLLNETRPNMVMSGNDPNAKVIAFAGCPNLSSGTVNVHDVLAKVQPPTGVMDAVSEHTYGLLMLPEKNYGPGVAALRSQMTIGGCPTTMPLWDTEEGIHADGDGYKSNWISETDVAQYYARDVITALSVGSQRLFWFSADNSPTYGFAVTFGEMTPRPRLAILNGCASMLEGLTFQKSYIPSGKTTYAHMFKGTNVQSASVGVCAIWNNSSAMSVSLAFGASKLQAFDTMGNAIAVTGNSTSATIPIPVQRPTFLQCAGTDYTAFDAAISGMAITAISPVTITTKPVVGGVQVTVTGASAVPADGIVSLVPAAARTPVGWPSPQHFQGLAMGTSITLRFSLPNKAGVKQVQVVCGDRQLVTATVPYSGH